MHRLNRFIIPIIIFIAVIASNNIQWGGTHWKDIIEADGKGYYAHLPAIFIYHDLNFSFFDSIEKKYQNPQIYYDYRVNFKGKVINKYFSGTALAMAPFFLIAHWSSSLFNQDSDGYSKIYLVMINIAAIFYLWVGLFYLKKILKNFSSNETLISFILVLIVFATNLFYYTVCEPAMSHIYSFAFITAFFYYSKKYFEMPNSKDVVILSFLFGIIVLIRPVNALIVLIIPFASGSWPAFINGLVYLLKKYKLLIISIFIVSFIIGIQFLIYKIQTGCFFVDSYNQEKFNWFSPQLLNFLVSYKKGMFVYTPILFFSLFGFVSLFNSNRFRFYSLLLFLIILIYVLSSWWNWWYGGSFGTRVILEYYSVFAILLLFVIESIKKKFLNRLFCVSLVLTLFLCQLQMYQYRYYHIHWEKMDKEHYWRTFLRIDLVAKNINLNKDLLQY